MSGLYSHGCEYRKNYWRIIYFRAGGYYGSFAVITPLKAQELILIEHAFVALPFKLRDWRAFVQHPFHTELWNGL